MTYIEEAIHEWSNGRLISVDLWFKLADQGYDVQALEDRYFV